MLGRKFSDKFKIVTAVLAVLVVASALIAYNALATDSSDVQDNLSASNGDVVAYQSVRAVEGVTISASGKNWTNDSSSFQMIGRYNSTFDGYDTITEGIIESKINVTNGDLTVTSIDVEGVRLDGETPITAGITVSQDELSIKLTQAGNYTATIALSDGSEAVFYAQIGKKQLNVAFTSASQNNQVYDGTPKAGVFAEVGGASFNFIEGFTIESVTGYYFVESGDPTEADRITEGITTYEEGNSFTVTDAGEYSATVRLADDKLHNFEWASNPESATKTFGGFTVMQACITGQFDLPDPDNNSYLDSNSRWLIRYLPNMDKSTLTKETYDGGYGLKFSVNEVTESGTPVCKVELECYKDNKYTQPMSATDFNVDASTNRYIRVSKLVAVEEGDTTYRSYRLPTQSESSYYDCTLIFRIRFNCLIELPVATNVYFEQSSFFDGDKLEVPEISKSGTTFTISALYKGFDYQLKYFLGVDNWESDYYAKGMYWDVTADGQTVDLDDYSMRNVKPGNAAYVISITPKSNYAWDNSTTSGSTNAYKYSIKIKPYELYGNNIVWDDSKYIYDDGNAINFAGGTFNFWEGWNDDLDFEFELTTTEGRNPIFKLDEEGKPTSEIIGYGPVVNAGEYPVRVTRIKGQDVANYKLSTERELTHTFVVHKKSLDPALLQGTVVTGTFNGDEQTFDVTEEMIARRMLERVNGDLNIIGIEVSVAYVNPWVSVGQGFEPRADYRAGIFTATHAGKYSVTLQFSATYQGNYCWPEASDLPKSESGTYRWVDFAVIDRAQIPTLTADERRISTESDYVDMSTLLTGYLDGGENKAYSIVEFGDNLGHKNAAQNAIDFNSETGKHLEGNYYILLELQSDFEYSCYFVEEAGEVEVLQNGKQAKLYYSVSSNAVNVAVNGSGYTFGDNFGASGVSPSDVLRVTSNKDIASVEYNFFEDADCEQAVASGNLVNALPRNAGKYYAQVTVTFDDSEIESRIIVKEITVSVRQLSVTWQLDGSDVGSSVTVSFNGTGHTVAASVTPVSGASDVSVTVSDAANLKDVNQYTFDNASLALSGGDSANYALASASFTLNITPMTVTVYAPELSNIIYGETLEASLLVPTGTDAFLSGDYNNDITIYVYDSNGARITDYGKLNRGVYTLVPVWGANAPANIGDYTVTQGNYEIIMQTKTFAVVAQQLTVTLQNLSGQYGDTVTADDLYEAIVSVTGLTNDEVKDCLTVTATKNGVSVTDDRAAVGTYTISVQLKNANSDYTLGDNVPTAQYTINRRSITLYSPEVKHTYGLTSYSSSYLSIDDVVNDSVLMADIDAKKVSIGARALQSNWGNISDYSALIVGGNYYNTLVIDKKSSITSVTEVDGQHQYTQNTTNYSFTVVLAKFEVVPRPLTIRFNETESSVYGDEFDLYRQKTNSSGKPVTDGYGRPVYVIFDELTGLVTGHAVGDAVTLTLVNYVDNVEVGAVVNAGNYKFKATVSNPNYTIADGENDGEYIIGGKYVVTQRNVSVTVTCSNSTITYGDSLSQAGITLNYNITVGDVVNGDALCNVGVLSGAEDVTDSIASQNVGDYKVGLIDKNPNYNITYSEINFTVKARAVTVTPTTVTNHVYGNALAQNELDYSGSNFVSDEHLTALGIVKQVYNGSVAVADANVSKLNVGDYTIKLSVTNANVNYNVTLQTAQFKVVKRDITLTAKDVDKHVYGTALGEGELTYDITSDLKIVNNDNLNIALQVYDGSNPVAAADVATLAVGDYTIKISHNNNPNYSITVNDAKFSVVLLEITVTFKTGASSVYGEEVDLSKAYEVTGTLIGDDKVTATAKLNGVAASSTAPVGIYIVTVYAPNDNYIIKYADESVTTGAYEITVRNVTIKAKDVTAHTYGEALSSDELDFDVTSELKIVNGDNLNIALAIYNSATDISAVADVAVLDAANYVIKASFTANDNYFVTSENGVFTVVPREITVTFVPATKPVGESQAFHTKYYADNEDSNIVDKTLYSNKVIVVGDDDLVNGATIRDVIELTAVNGAHNATEQYAPAGEYTITPKIKDGNINYVIKNSDVTGTYVIGKAQLTMISTYPIVIGTYGYTGEAQAVFNEAVEYKAVDGSAATVLYKATTEKYNGALDKDFFADGKTELPAPTNVGTYYIYVIAMADDNHETAKISLEFVIVPVTLTVTAKDVELTYHDELSSADWYEHEVTTAATVPYAGLNADVLNGYLSKITRSTGYATSTPAEATGIVIAPVYDNGSTGDANVIVECVEGTVTIRKAEITDVNVTSGHASGAYTGEDFNLFDAMNATTVNNQAVTWYYREVGQTDWTAYNNDTIADVCSKQLQVKASANNHNDKIYENNINFVITQNSITVKADDKQIVYGESLDSLTFGGTLSGSDNGLLAEVLNAYIAAATYTASGYSVTTAAGSELAITSAYAGDANVSVTVNEGTLTVTTRSITVTFDNNQHGTYGDDVEQSVVNNLCAVSGMGLVNGDSLTVSAVLDGTSATSVKAPAGTYVVTATASDNYTIDYANGSNGVYVINPRKVTVAIVSDSVVYTEDDAGGVINYHGGEYGKTQYVLATFANTVDDFVIDSHYTVTYADASSGASATPNKVGKYKATIAVADGNYELTGETVFDYEITVKHIASSTFMWEDSTFSVTEDNDKFDNVLIGYINDILAIDSFKFTIKNSEPQDVEFGGEGFEGNNKYYFDSNGQLRISVESETSHVYTVIFGLNDKAKANYELTDSDVIDGLIERSFSILAKPIVSHVRQQGWQYSDEKGTLEVKILLGEGVEYQPQNNYSIMYAKVTNTADAKDLINAAHIGYDLDEINHLFEDGTLSATFDDFDVGYYIICVSYTGYVVHINGEDIDTEYVSIRRFDVFEVTKKVLTPPSFDSVIYNGQTQSLSVNYNTDVNGTALNDIVVATYNGADVLHGNAVNEKNVGDYTVYFTIKDDCADRYVWNDSDSAQQAVVWSIGKDEAANNKDYFEVANITSTYGETISLTDPSLKKEGYEGTFTWWFAIKAEGVDPADIEEWVGRDRLFSNAGAYVVKVVLHDANNNFSDKVDYAELTINKASLTLTPNGSLTYGDAFDQGEYNYTLSGFVNGENEQSVTFEGSVGYALKDAGVKLVVNSDGYDLVATSALIADNYTVTAVLGKLIISKRNVAVVIGDATIEYGLEMTLSTVTATSTDAVATSEIVTEVVKHLSIEENLAKYVVGDYHIVSSYRNDNFEIAYTRGIYKVTARTVTVTLDNTQAGGIYGLTINPVTFTVNDDGNGLAQLVKDEYAITVVYGGDAFDNVAYVGMPTHAGNFTATVAGDLDNKNFALTIPEAVNFVVAKQALDESKIKAVPNQRVFTGEAITPVLNDEYKGLYTELAHDSFVSVGDYTLEIQLNDAFNYKWTVSETDIVGIAFAIVPAGIKVKPHGTIVYGQTFANATFDFVLTYVNGGATVEDGVVTIDENAIGYFVNDVLYNAAKPAAGRYALEMEKVSEGSDFVKGFSATDYTIVLEVGEFVVEKKNVELTVRNSSSIFSQSITLNNDFDVTGLAWDEDKSVIKNYTITSDPSGWINAGDDYTVTATATADNYEISFKNGTHTIEQIKVVVAYAVTDGIYLDLDKVATVKASFNATNLSGYIFPADFETKLIRKITGSKDYDSSEVPTNAGSYAVTATGISDTNYLFVSSDTKSFTIAKKVVDETAITVQSKEYNGETQSHGITALTGVYTVSDGVYKDADTYDITLTLVDPDNYAWQNEAGRNVTKQFVIDKATLTLTPEGTMVYGEEFRQTDCLYTLTGFKGNDNASAVDINDVTYTVVGGGDKLIVKDYTLTAQINGITALNYNVVPENGKFSVTKRHITIKPVDASSVYSQSIAVINDFEILNGGKLAFNDDKSVINLRSLGTTANSNSDVGAYPITASASADNYEVEVLVGTYTIEQIKVGVVMRAIDGVYGDRTNSGYIRYLTVVATNLDGEPALDGLTFNVVFSGEANNGQYVNSTTMPTLAGLYRARIAGVNNDNYTIDRTYGICETTIEIAKRSIDARGITVNSASYTGKAIFPTITDNLNSGGIYTVSYGDDYADGFVDVGNYQLTLTLMDTDNYCWLDNRNAYTTVRFQVVKADNAIVDDNGNVSHTATIEIADWTIDDVASTPSVKLLNGEDSDVVFEYSTIENGGFTTKVPTSAGTYWVRAVVSASKNYNAYVSKAVSFTINKRIVEMPVVVSNGSSVYSGEMLSLNITNYDDKVMSLNCDLFSKNSNGTLTLSALNAGTYTARLVLRDTTNYDWADKSQLVDGAVVVTWTIERKVLAKLENATNKIYVNGSDIAFTPEGFNSGIMTISGNVHAHKGHYSAVVTLKDRNNYAWEGIDGDSISVEFDLVGTNTAFIAIICVVAGLCVGLGVMALILTLVNRSKKRKQAEAIDKRSRDDGWNE